MPVRLGLFVHNAAAVRMEHLIGYVGIVRSEKYKTGNDFFRLAGPGPVVYPNQTSPLRWYFVGAGAVEFPFPSTFKSDFRCS
jgi:hypothetical protein